MGFNEWLKNKKLSTVTGVVIGDSIAEGHPAVHSRLNIPGGGYDLSRPNEDGQISYYLEQLTGLKIFNHGIGGQRSDQIRERWDRDALARIDAALTPDSTLTVMPAFLVLICGINDVFQGRTAVQIETDIDYMIDSMINNNILPIVFNIGPHFQMDTVKLAVVEEVNAWLAARKSRTSLMRLIDYYRYANDPDNNGKPKLGVLADDVHPAKHTYRELSGIVFESAFI